MPPALLRRPARPRGPAPAVAAPAPAAEADGRAAILAEIKRRKKFFHGTVVAQAQRIDLAGDRLAFTFTAAQRTLAAQVEQNRGWLEEMASQAAGRKVTVVAERSGADPQPDPPPAPAAATEGTDDLRESVLGDQVVQAMLDVFGAEIRDVEKIEP